MKFIHLTDPHFAPPGKLLYGLEPRAGLDAAVADINAHHADADLAVVTGDLTHWGEPRAFENLADSLRPLKMPVQLLIGNHDHRETFRAHFPGQGADPNGFVQSALETEAGLFLFLDTVKAGASAGEYCDKRCAWLAETLAAAPKDRPVYLFMHHPPFATGVPAADRIGLLQPEGFHAAVSPHLGRIRHLFFGHVHRPMCGSWRGVPFSTLRGTSHQVWLDFESDALYGSHEPPAYGVVLVDGDCLVVHSHDFRDASPKFKLHGGPYDDWCNRERARAE